MMYQPGTPFFPLAFIHSDRGRGSYRRGSGGPGTCRAGSKGRRSLHRKAIQL